ncbi:RHS repeat-associated core domain-containing protein (plasmid) [Leptospira interrogans]|nr:RHS repeat-associated core domain-containing protein [Leptospira interrogans]UML83150.1 RHS repeat-associated core domain-containing protein [Leptospira interrogans]
MKRRARPGAKKREEFRRGTPLIPKAYFYHPNHLGSIQMITDGAGNPASGLYYYKSRFYEPTLGRFIQADTVIDPESVNGQNRYMYVEGNPVNYKDSSGHSLDMMFYAALYQYAQLPNSPKKEQDSLMLLALHNQQIRNTSGPGCPASGKNNLVWGNYQGAGMCGGKLPKEVEKFMGIFLFLGNPELSLAIYFLYKPNSALTIVDRSGIAHDELHKWSTSKGAIHANEQWIKKSWGNFYSIHEQRAAYKREYDALPKSYDRYGKTGKSILAGVNYLGTTAVDYYGPMIIGTTLFSVQNYFAYQAQFIHHATFVHKARYNNFWKPNKWKL